MIRVTDHACQRYRERVERCPLQVARERILSHARAIEAAAAFGCEVVRLGGGERLVIDGLTVVTVYERHTLPRQLLPNHHHLGDNEWL